MKKQTAQWHKILPASLLLALIVALALATVVAPTQAQAPPVEVTVVIDDCEGGYLPGVQVQWYKWGSASTKFPAGTTSDSGPLTFFVDGATYPNIAVYATYKNRSVVAGPQLIASNPVFTYTSVLAEVDLQDNLNSDIPITPANNLQFYAWGFAGSKHLMDLVSGNGEQCLLPGDYIFTMTYQDTTLTSPRHTIVSGEPYVFVVEPAALKLLFFGVRK